MFDPVLAASPFALMTSDLTGVLWLFGRMDRSKGHPRFDKLTTNGLFFLGSSAILLLALSGCASVPTGPTSPAAPLMQRETLPFNLNGRLAVRHLDRRHSGGLRWQHQAQRDELLLQGPLGITAARIVSDAHSASLEQSGKTYRAEDVESLMRQVLGWGLPLPVLHHWLLGEADAASPVDIERDAQGRIAVLRQAGWEVRYLRYVDDNQDSLPARISLSREDLQIQLLIDEWEFAPQ